MSSRKDIWAGMDKLEGKKEGSSHAALNKERVRQGYKPESAAKSKALKARTITLKSGEIIEAGKKHREPAKKHLKSWGDELPKHYRGNTNSEGGIPFGKAPKGDSMSSVKEKGSTMRSKFNIKY